MTAIQNIIDHPWAFLGLVLILVLLHWAASMRLRHERRRKERALVDRRQKLRAEADRRWLARPRHK
ncbi:MAG: hypothetical protein H6R10_3647 [Rhodocyclaceae bacterium]|nr:hypothetical protein [Rhodocyclaceae bacterium]